MESSSTIAACLSCSPDSESRRITAPDGASGMLPLNPLGNSGWENLLATHPQCGFFHTSAWAKVLHDAYGYTPFYFTACEQDRLLGLWPFMEVNSWLTGKRGVCLPFTDECQPIFSDTAAAQRCLQEITEHGRRRGWKYWECRGTNLLPENLPASTAYYGHVLDLSAGQTAIYERFKGSVRTAIRKAEKSAIKVEAGSSWELLREFYQLNCQTRQKHGLPPQPLSFFRCIWENVFTKNLGTVVVGRHEGRPVSAAVFFHFGKKVIYKYGASDETVKELSATNLVLWAAIQQSISEGREEFNFGRSSVSNEGLRKFKLAWATREVSIKYLKYDLRKEMFVTDGPETDGWQNRVFRLMPQFLSRKIGALLYKHVA